MSRFSPAEVVELIEETGDHPLNGAFCPGRRRAPWTADRVRTDAMAGLRLGVPAPRGMHRGAPAPLLSLAELLAADELVDQVLRGQIEVVSLQGPAAGLVCHEVDAGAR